MGEQKMTARHLLVALTCIVGIFTTSAITFSCPGLCYKPVANLSWTSGFRCFFLYVRCLLR